MVVYNSMPIIALRGLVVFPGTKLHFEIGRKKSIKALDAALESDRKIFLVAQKNITDEDPDFSGLYSTGVIATVEQVIKVQGGDTVRAVVSGIERAAVASPCKNKSFLQADIETKDSIISCINDSAYEKALVAALKDAFEDFVDLSGKFAKDVLISVYGCDRIDVLSDIIAGNAIESVEIRQEILEQADPVLRGQKLLVRMKELIELETIRQDIEDKVQENMDKAQKEYYLHEEMKVIKAQLHEDNEDEENEYTQKIVSLNLSDDTTEKLLKEAGKLAKMQSLSPEANVIRGYLDAVLELPWNKYTKENTDIEKARRILDKEHYGLEKVKERFIESLCIRSLGANPNNQIICLVGPPGVGKTSIAMSVAKAMNRKFARVSLGGVSDEAEIRGHRRTYIGSMPGKIMAAVEKAGSSNALILLDEVDKLGKDYKGDPSSALLEVLDGEQNHSFVDHFIDVPFDLSKILFITTANDASQIPPALYDRMEKIEIEGYTFEEKVNIAKKHLIKKQRTEHGLKAEDITITKSAIEYIIEKYTREAGVRALEKYIATICRKAAVKKAEGFKKVTVKAENTEEFLSSPKYLEKANKGNRVGVVNGLAWTAAGGEILEVEAAVFDGTGKVQITGNLGDVMKESASLAVSVVRGVAEKYKLDGDFYKNKDIHIHVPQGAVPKDGPSGGVTMSTALLSALSGRKVRGDIAMTGEISLTGRVMPIGGIKEKSMAAYRNKIKTVIIPEDNLSDLSEISSAVKESLEFIPVSNISQVFSLALI